MQVVVKKQTAKTDSQGATYYITQISWGGGVVNTPLGPIRKRQEVRFLTTPNLIAVGTAVELDLTLFNEEVSLDTNDEGKELAFTWLRPK